ncbi:outer membrane lipoprotein-sorting protein [Ideonella sp. 4Y11]|uniref:Outer membrane lipoprotein-sorting protein n=1 Tax=Ideonella aquatica TaxID=2824119 RepID=A0A940YJ14_9BURK|nr:outer membrane lipoprotein-sorting protein [Ideonella aquatica]MBQ0957967.1 outer membrane lipoprotein-sorting protein [Ideonella aquatica]
MKLLRILLALALALAGAASLATAADEASRILEASDAVRNPDKPFRLRVTLTEYRDGRQTAQNGMDVFSRLLPGERQYANLVRFVAPERDLNKLMLKSGKDLWFYDPTSKAQVRIAPQQRLLGQVSNGDVVTTNWSQEYQAEIKGPEDILDGDRQTCKCMHLSLSAKVQEATYKRIDLWVNASHAPIKAYFHSESGHLLKTAFYRKYKPVLGSPRPTEMVIIDGLQPNWVTVMRFGDHAWFDVPDSWLRPEYLARVKVN